LLGRPEASEVSVRDTRLASSALHVACGLGRSEWIQVLGTAEHLRRRTHEDAHTRSTHEEHTRGRQLGLQVVGQTAWHRDVRIHGGKLVYSTAVGQTCSRQKPR
jgi:hypothetical protein